MRRRVIPVRSDGRGDVRGPGFASRIRISSLLQDAAQAITAGKLNRAESDLQSVLRAAPEDYRALDLLGVVRVLQRRETEAAEQFSATPSEKA